MTWWKHRSQTGGYISLEPRKRVHVRGDGAFEAPDDARITSRLERAGHERLERVPGPERVRTPKDRDPRAEKRARSKARVARRAAEGKTHVEPTGGTKEERKPVEPTTTGSDAGPASDEPSMADLRVLADAAEVGKGGGKVDIVARLTEAGVDVEASLAKLAETEDGGDVELVLVEAEDEGKEPGEPAKDEGA